MVVEGVGRVWVHQRRTLQRGGQLAKAHRAACGECVEDAAAPLPRAGSESTLLAAPREAHLDAIGGVAHALVEELADGTRRSARALLQLHDLHRLDVVILLGDRERDQRVGLEQQRARPVHAGAK